MKASVFVGISISLDGFIARTDGSFFSWLRPPARTFAGRHITVMNFPREKRKPGPLPLPRTEDPPKSKTTRRRRIYGVGPAL
jgi:hypothetical protein